ncbi:MAG TPA: hypothetical protein DCL43_05365, partial [Chitinophagaceae bacterium]|nr:hypothetical protein [Chitinophagaceae bacterium]
MVTAFDAVGQDNVGIGGAPRSGFKLDVRGNINADGRLLLYGRNVLRSDSIWNSTFGGNVTLGTFAGANMADTALGNSFFGFNSGQATRGHDNSFFGANAGVANTLGRSNVFMGRGAGELNTSGSNNVFMGAYSGFSNTTGTGLVFLGN